jgi:septal ring factor EnvC (AmiA/AmiB activator)
MSQQNDCQSRLNQLFREQLQEYQKAESLITTITQRLEQRGDPQSDLQQLNSIMLQIASQDQLTRDLRERAFNQSTGLAQELRDTTKQLQEFVEGLLGRIAKVLELAKTARDGLMPRMSQQTVSKKMLQAYGA